MSAPRIGRFVRFLQNEVCKFAERKLVKPDFTAALAATMQTCGGGRKVKGLKTCFFRRPQILARVPKNLPEGKVTVKMRTYEALHNERSLLMSVLPTQKYFSKTLKKILAFGTFGYIMSS